MSEESQKLMEYAYALYETHQQDVKPRYPWVMVRVLPKEQKRGMIYVPQVQNKVLYEGLVLRTYDPFYRHFKTKKENGDVKETEVYVEPSVKVGDHVVFPHYEGMPLLGLFDPTEYRMLKEDVIQAIVMYTEPTERQLKKIVNKDKAVEAILRDFYVLPKNGTSKTTSGE